MSRLRLTQVAHAGSIGSSVESPPNVRPARESEHAKQQIASETH